MGWCVECEREGRNPKHNRTKGEFLCHTHLSRAYRQTEAGKVSVARYKASEKRRISNKRYYASEKGQQRARRAIITRIYSSIERAVRDMEEKRDG